MTRANINYVFQRTGHAPEVLYLYQNGDQYPRGIRDFYKVLDFTNGDWSKNSFIKWIGDNYKETQSVAKTSGDITIVSNYEPTEIPAKPSKIKHACIYFDTANFPTDYSYIFDSGCYSGNKVIVYNWLDKIFEGNPKEFETWIKKQK